MLAALVIVFREVLEAGLVVGVVLAATKGLAGRGWWIALGIAGGVVGAALVAGFAAEIANLFQGSGQEALNAAVLLLAVVMLAWTTVWMSKHGREMTAELKSVGKDVVAGRKPLTALAIVVGVAVLREGFEVVLFLYGVLASGATTAGEVVVGGLLGILGGAAVAAALYFGLVAIPLKHLFKAITVLITLLAAGLASQAMAFLQQGGFVTVLTDTAWDTSWLLTDGSIAGRVVGTLVGYTAEPSWLQLIAYVVTIVAIVALARYAARPQAKAPIAAA